MFYTVYKITNKINGKVYIGSHKTKNLDDGYMGSGKYLKRAIEKHGSENFLKEILYVFDTPEEMYSKESELVDDEFLTESNTYNLKKGGFGGWDYNNSYEGQKLRTHTYENWSKSGTESLRDKFAKDENFRKNRIEHLRKIAPLAKMKQKQLYPEGTWKGKSHSEETKRKIGSKNSLNQLGERNSSFGTKWIFSEELKLSRKIKKNEELPEGWSYGRKLNF